MQNKLLLTIYKNLDSNTMHTKDYKQDQDKLLHMPLKIQMESFLFFNQSIQK